MKVNEIFGPTIQGEGKSLGMKTMFLRLAGCNLACIWCDTPYTWNYTGTPFRHPEKYKKSDEVEDVSVFGIISRLKQKGPNVKSLVITGGEPMLQQKEIVSLLKILKPDNYWVEIETNGTIEPSDEFLGLIDQINCSPKTGNSGLDNTLKMRERPEALNKLSQSDKTFYKFVVQDERDLSEIKNLISRYNMRNIYLMAEGGTRAEQIKMEDLVREICLKNGFCFSPRLHILLWNRARGH